MSTNILVTGTDTEVGKTFISCALLHAFKAHGRSVNALKPLETGGIKGQPGPDAHSLATTLGVDAENTFWSSYSGALAPMHAATLADEAISTPALEAQCKQHMKGADVTLIEGAGGILVPITANYSYLDLVLALQIPVVIVAANRLGVLNHTLLSVEVLKNKGVSILGVVLNDVQQGQHSLAQSSNLGVLTQCIGDIPMVAAPYMPASSKKAFTELGNKLLSTFFERPY